MSCAETEPWGVWSAHAVQRATSSLPPLREKIASASSTATHWGSLCVYSHTHWCACLTAQLLLSTTARQAQTWFMQRLSLNMLAGARFDTASASLLTHSLQLVWGQTIRIPAVDKIHLGSHLALMANVSKNLKKSKTWRIFSLFLHTESCASS